MSSDSRSSDTSTVLRRWIRVPGQARAAFGTRLSRLGVDFAEG